MLSTLFTTERSLEFFAQLAGLASDGNLKLLALKVQIPGFGHLGFGLVDEERIVQNLIIDIHAPELGRFRIFCLLFQRLGVFLLRVVVANLLNSRGANKIRQLPRRLLDPSLTLQKRPLLAPMSRHRDRVPVRLEKDE